MRKIILFIAILVMAGTSVATTTVTGNLTNLGTGAANGFVRFWLRGCGGNQPRVNSVAVVAPSQGGVYFFDFHAVGGAISGTLYSTRGADGTSAGELECGGSFSMWYGMQIFTNGKGGPEIPVAAKNGVVLDVSNVTPINVTPVATAPTGDNTYLRLDGGNTPVTGRVQFNLGLDFPEIAQPANPPAATGRLYLDRGNHKLTCIDSTGQPCFPTSSGGAGTTIPAGVTNGLIRYLDGLNALPGLAPNISDDGTTATAGKFNNICNLDGVHIVDLPSAITCAGSSGTIVVPPSAGTLAVTGTPTIPAGVKLKVEDGAILSVATSLTIAGPLDAGLYQIFSGAGTVSFTSPGNNAESRPEWWGGKADGSSGYPITGTDNLAAFNSALAALPVYGGLPTQGPYTLVSGAPARTGRILLSPGRYVVSNTLVLSPFTSYECPSFVGCWIVLKDGVATGSEVWTINVQALTGPTPNTSYGAQFKNVSVDTNSNVSSGGHNTFGSGVIVNGAQGTGLGTLWIENCGKRGFWLANSSSNLSGLGATSDVEVLGCNIGPGIQLDASVANFGTLRAEAVNPTCINGVGPNLDADNDCNPGLLIGSASSNGATNVNIEVFGAEFDALPMKIWSGNAITVQNATIGSNTGNAMNTAVVISHGANAVSFGPMFTFAASPNVFTNLIVDRTTSPTTTITSAGNGVGASTADFPSIQGYSNKGLKVITGGLDAAGTSLWRGHVTSQANPNSPQINCVVGETIFSTGSTNGQNNWNCTATNTWTQNLNSGAAGMSTSAGNASAVAVPVDWSPSGTGGQNLGAAAHPWGTLYFGAAATNNWHFAGSATAARTITWQDASGTVPFLATAQAFTANQTFLRVISASTNAATSGCFVCLGPGDRITYWNPSLVQTLNLIGDGGSGPVPVGDVAGISVGPVITGQVAGTGISLQPLAATGSANGGITTIAGGVGAGAGKHGDVIIDAGVDGVTRALTGIGFPVVNNPTTSHPVSNDLGSYLAGQAVITPHASTLNLAGVCIRNCSTSGTAIFVRNGLAYLNLDNAGVAGDLVYISQTTDGFGTDVAVGSAPSSQYVGRVVTSVSGTLYQVDVCIGCESFASAAAGAVALNPGTNQTLQATSAAVTGLILKCPASAGSTQACMQVTDNTGANIFQPQQNGQIQIGTGVGGSIQLTDILGPNATPASAGLLRNSDTDVAVAWRNHANTGNITVSKNTNDVVLVNSPVNASQLQTTGPLDFLETTAPSAVAGHDICYADSTSHSVKCSWNNGSFVAFPLLAGDLSGTSAAPIVSKIDGTSIPVNSAADQSVVTTASATGSWATLPNCGDASHGLAYSTSTHTYSCQTITGTAGNLADPGGNGILSRTALNTTVNRTITGGSGITVTNGDGVSGNPTAVVDTTVVATTSDTLTLTNKTVDAEGTGNVFTRPFYVEFAPGCNSATGNPGSFDVPTAAATTFTCFGTTTTQGALDFVDASTTTATGHFTLPQGWVGNMDVRIFWFAGTSSANAVRFSAQTGCVADSQAVSTGPSYNTASASNTAYTGTANQRKTTLLSAVDMTNCSAGETLYFQISRVGADAGDTLTATAEVMSVQFEGRATK